MFLIDEIARVGAALKPACKHMKIVKILTLQLVRGQLGLFYCAHKFVLI